MPGPRGARRHSWQARNDFFMACKRDFKLARDPLKKRSPLDFKFNREEMNER
jgi:hypothetical protein